tara:strand:- start:251 stop:619 length:369 start_codon:yes stop_codon:yes gene_type:complete
MFKSKYLIKKVRLKGHFLALAYPHKEYMYIVYKVIPFFGKHLFTYADSVESARLLASLTIGERKFFIKKVYNDRFFGLYEKRFLPFFKKEISVTKTLEDAIKKKKEEIEIIGRSIKNIDKNN